MSSAKEILDKVKQYLIDLKDEECDLSLTELLHQLEVDYDSYKEALKISKKGQIVILKRRPNERNVNNYNQCFISAMMANMDLQFVSDLHAVVTYVTDYFSKDDEQLTKVLKEALTESADCDDFQRLNHLKKTFFTHRQVNVAEATYGLIPGMDLKGSNVGTVFIASGFPDNRHKRLYRVDKESDKEEFKMKDG